MNHQALSIIVAHHARELREKCVYELLEQGHIVQPVPGVKNLVPLAQTLRPDVIMYESGSRMLLPRKAMSVLRESGRGHDCILIEMMSAYHRPTSRTAEECPDDMIVGYPESGEIIWRIQRAIVQQHGNITEYSHQLNNQLCHDLNNSLFVVMASVESSLNALTRETLSPETVGKVRLRLERALTGAESMRTQLQGVRKIQLKMVEGENGRAA